MKIIKMQLDLTSLFDLIDQRHGHDAAAIKRFAEVYFESVTQFEFAEKNIEDLYGATFASWNFLQHRAKNEIKLKVFNPTQAENGWASTHSVIQILTDDAPFIIDTVRMEINRRHMSVHTVHTSTIQVERNQSGQALLNTLSKKLHGDVTAPEGVFEEAFVYLEIDKVTDETILEDIHEKLNAVLSELRCCVDDYPKFLQVLDVTTKELQQLPCERSEEEVNECLAFLKWLKNEHFTFIGYDEFTLEEEDGFTYVVRDKSKNLGSFRFNQPHENKKRVVELSSEIQAFMLGDSMINFFKSGARSRIHRPAYSDYVVVKRFNETGEVIGGVRFMGLYTSSVYLESPKTFPIIRKKIEAVWRLSELDTKGYSGKELNRILEVYPRDELIQSTEAQLFNTAMGILSMKERRRTRIFARKDTYGKFISCLCYTPRDIFNTELRLKIQNVLAEAWCARDVEFDIFLSESMLARMYFVFRLEPNSDQPLNVTELEKTIQKVASFWEDDFHNALIKKIGEEKGNQLFFKYRTSFPVAYREYFTPETATLDILQIDELKRSPVQHIGMSFYREIEENKDQLQFKLFTTKGLLPLSDLLPVLENFGLRIIEEYPYAIECSDGLEVYIHHLSIVYTLAERVDMQAVKSLFQQAFRKIWDGVAEDDTFNKLVLGAGIDWRDIAMMRAYARYMKQTLFGISEPYIAETLVRYIRISKLVIQAFNAKFGLYSDWTMENRESVYSNIRGQILTELDTVEQLNEDRVFRCYLQLIDATLRTNFFQLNEIGYYKPYLSFKLSPGSISHLPEPHPLYEIFVYSSKVEGVHLRGGRVARGGLRWSDRNEDFRTEVLGLVKAQQVKNSVIVPVGAKGGFVAKKLNPEMSRDEVQAEGIACYETFINALLDVTDNVVSGEIDPPPDVVRHDGDDVYLVVAADKGTATFSDISNNIALKRGFWLGDAFASGGSIGYDHKKMGITAKGAWVSVQRHFRQRGVDIQNESISVVAIGDMSGDVFGNGMLLSPCIKLVAAFNHQHIFIDPTPNLDDSFQERQRLFKLPRSSWGDYDKSFISNGGGVFSRAAKSIAISEDMQSCFDITEEQLTPTELIQYLLKSRVDLIWNGGIGTYIKSADESNSDVGDKANDSVRVNGGDVRARVIGEGGNLGLTQLGRIEYSLAGGACFTDFIDNSGGVDCSDHEVNIKIMLNDLVQKGDITIEERNSQFLALTDEVGQLVLDNNYRQTQAINFLWSYNIEWANDYIQVLERLEQDGKLNRSLEFLPTNDMISDRVSRGQGLTLPELSVLISYVKSDLKVRLNCPEISDDPYFNKFLTMAFPSHLTEQYQKALKQHKLRSEIIATQLANDMVNFMGITFVDKMLSTYTSRTVVDFAKAYVVAREVFELEETMLLIRQLDYKVSSQTQEDMMYYLIRMIRRSSRWMLINRNMDIDVSSDIAFFKQGIDSVKSNMPIILKSETKTATKMRFQRYLNEGVEKKLASFVASSSMMISTLGIVEVAKETQLPVDIVANAYFAISETLSLDWFYEQINALEVSSRWQEMAQISYRSDLDKSLRLLTKSLLCQDDQCFTDVQPLLKSWVDQNAGSINKWHEVLDQIRVEDKLEYPMFFVALEELHEMATFD